MNFKFSEKEEALRKEIREFVKKELPSKHPGALFEEEHYDEDWEFAMSISKKLGEKGWLTMSWPKEYGGMGASHWEHATYLEEVGYWGIPGTGMGVSGVAWVGPSLVLFGSDEQKQKYMPLIAAGDPDGVWCTGYSEPDAGSDFANIRTRADKDGDEYVINGQKVWTSCAHRARYYWLAVKTDPDAKKKHHGISLFIVDMKSKGITVRPILNYVGFHLLNEVFLDDVRVPKENLVGVENKGWYQLMQALGYERGSVGIAGYAANKRLLEELVEYTKETGQIKDPDIRQKLADIAVDVESMKLIAYQTIWKLEQGELPIYEPSRDKIFADNLLRKISTIGSEILRSYSTTDPMDKDYKWTKINAAIQKIYWSYPGIATAAGTNETQKNIIGQFALGLPKSY